ncbi:MAG: dienelactone hydrolase family protein [Ignavibacteriota bacterium]
MKYFFVLFLMGTLSSSTLQAQHICCAVDANTRFAMLMNNDDFMREHATPLPFHPSDLQGSMISFPCATGPVGSAYLSPSKLHPNKVVLMFHEFWGLNDYIKKEADNLSRELGITVCAIDLYDGKVGTTREEAQTYMKALTQERGNYLIDGAITFFGKDIRFGTIGWCMGGGWSQRAALRGADQVDACVIYYGMPETSPEKLKDMHAEVLGIFGNKDKWITPKVVSDYQDAMKEAGKKLTVKSYDADHAFANPSNPDHNKKATDDAHTHTVAFFKRVMKLK